METNRLAHRNLDELKKNIDLVDYAASQGYQVDKAKSTNKHLNMSLEANGNKDTIIVYRHNENGHHGYFNPNDTRDKGSVIDFERYRNKDGWKGTFEALDAYLGKPNTMGKPAAERLPETDAPRREKAINNEFQFKPLTDTAYLEGRGLNKQTYSAPEFEGRIFNKLHTTEGGKTYVNTAFPLRNEEGTVSAIIRNDQLKMVQRDTNRGEGAWISNTNFKPGKVSTLVITESPEDALSYHQLKPPSADEKRVYYATGGSVSIGQQRLVNVVNNALEPKQIILANDNDTGGFRNNIHVIGSLKHKESPDSAQVQIQLSQQTRTNIILSINLAHGHEKEGLEKIRSVTDRFTQGFAKLAPAGVEPDYSIRVNAAGKNQSELEIHFANNRPNLIEAQRMVIETKGLQNLVKVDRAQNKDFNEDVQKGVKYVNDSIGTSTSGKLPPTSTASESSEPVKVPSIGFQLSSQGEEILSRKKAM